MEIEFHGGIAKRLTGPEERRGVKSLNFPDATLGRDGKVSVGSRGSLKCNSTVHDWKFNRYDALMYIDPNPLHYNNLFVTRVINKNEYEVKVINIE